MTICKRVSLRAKRVSGGEAKSAERFIVGLSRLGSYRVEMPKSSVFPAEPPASRWAWLAWLALSLLRRGLE